jgi:enoyl-CoA hydratase
MSYETLDVETTDHRRRVTIDRAGKPNPMNRTVLDELDAAIRAAEADPVRVLSIYGRGRVFASGSDLADIDRWFTEGAWDEMLRFLRRGQAVLSRLEALDLPTIAAIDGAALGGGCELALACDFRIASERSEFGFPEIDLGMIPGWGGTQRLPALVGTSTAKDLLLTARRVDGQEAAEMGLVTRVVDDGELEATVDAFASTLAEKPPTATSQLLAAVDAGAESPLETGLSHELVSDMLASTTEEAKRRTKAFVEGDE